MRPRRTNGSSEGQDVVDRQATGVALNALDHPVGLRVVGGGRDVLDAKGATKGRPG